MSSKYFLGSSWASYPVDLAEAMKSIASAIFLKEIAYWMKYSEDGWVFRTNEQIREATALTRKVQETARRHLKRENLIEEELRGWPATVHYKVDFEAVDKLLADAPNRTQDAPNGQRIYRYTNKDTTNDANASAASRKMDGKIQPLDQWLTKQIYEAMSEKYRMPNDDFGFHLGRAQDMLKKDNPTDQEIEDLPEWFVKRFEIYGKTDAQNALVYMRQQQARKERIKEDQDVGNGHPSYYETLEKSKDKAYPLAWYLSAYPAADPTWVKAAIGEGKSHSEIEAEISG